MWRRWSRRRSGCGRRHPAGGRGISAANGLHAGNLQCKIPQGSSTRAGYLEEGPVFTFTLSKEQLQEIEDEKKAKALKQKGTAKAKAGAKARK